jgi:6-phospho-3-hexuloisomerase
MTTTTERLAAVLDEMRGVFTQMAPDAVAILASEIVAARRIAVYGVGRNGLVLQALAMRLAHLGLDAAFVGQLAAPPVGQGDLFLVAAALGRLPTADALAATARNAGARIAILTAAPANVDACDCVIHLPAQTMADPQTSRLPLGSPFELALWLYCDLVVVELMARLSKTNVDLGARHANLL